MEKKTVLITGGNSGIGKHTAIELAKEGMEIIILSRTTSRGEEAKKNIIKKSNNPNIYIYQTDFSRFSSIIETNNKIKKKFKKIDILINNAGAFYSKYNETIDGIERQWQINHLAGFMLTYLLFPLIKKSNQGRIINVSSKGHYEGRLWFENLNRKQKYKNGLGAYCQSKLANVMFTKELAEKTKNTHITANSLHPGVVNTAIGNKNNKGLVSFFWFLWRPFMMSQKKGAQTTIYLASSKEISNISGKYFEKCKIKKPSRFVEDPVLRKKLWEISEEQTKINWKHML